MPVDTSAARTVSREFINEAFRYLDQKLEDTAWLTEHRVVFDHTSVQWTIVGNNVMTDSELAEVRTAYLAKGWKDVSVISADTPVSNWRIQFEAEM